MMIFLQNGLLSAVPHLVAVVYAIIFGPLSDLLIDRKCLQKKNVRRLMHGLVSCILSTFF